MHGGTTLNAVTVTLYRPHFVFHVLTYSEKNMEGWMDGCMYGGTDELMNGWMYVCMDGWMNAYIDRYPYRDMHLCP